MKVFVLLIITCCLVTSCKNKYDSQQEKEESKIIPSTSTQKPPTTVDNQATEVVAPVKKEYESVFPRGTWKTYPQIVRTLFSRFSTKEEVLSIMGRPELIEKGKESSETWYYGRIEIYFKYTHVEGGYRLDECRNYADLEQLLLSDDPIEKDFGIKLLNRTSTGYK